MLRLPAASGIRLLAAGAEEDCDGEAAAAAASSSYLRHLTELRWSVPEWEAAGGGAGRRWVGASGALEAPGAALPDLTPLLQASGLQVLQLGSVPETAQPQLEALCQRLPQLGQLQVNSARLLG